MRITRQWAMPSPHTFEIPPISRLLDEWTDGAKVIVDPTSGRSKRATHSNDLATGGKDACEWLDGLILLKLRADVVLLDPPYSPRQISECYKGVGMPVTMKDTQAGFYKRLKDRLDVLLKPNGIAITCGWNSGGFGKMRGYYFEEILLVNHGGAHNDTIVTVERKGPKP